MVEKEKTQQSEEPMENVMEEIKSSEKEEELEGTPAKLSLEEKKKAQEEKTRQDILDNWAPKTELGKRVMVGKESHIDEILASGKRILESQIVDKLLRLESDLLLVGQSKGKFGGGKRRAWRQTQKKTMEGNRITFSAVAVVGDKKGHVGVGYGKAKETLPAREKALREAKLNIVKITRGFETQEPDSSDPHTVPFQVEGKCGSVRIKLLPAPRRTGLVVGDEVKKVLRLAGIKDVYSSATGQTRTTLNLALACIDALKKTNKEMIK